MNIENLRSELAREEAMLMELENKVELHSAALSHLRSEYNANVDRVLSHFEPELRPLRQVISVLTEKMDLIRRRIAWLEVRAEARVAYEKDDNNRGKTFDERKDMQSRVSAWIKDAQSALESSYDAIRNCPPESLAMLSNYDCPPDAALATTRMVQQLRKDLDCSWAAARVLVSHNYFTAFFVPRAETMVRQCPLLDEQHMMQLEWFCAQPQYSVKALYASSTPIGCLGQWLHAVRDYYRVKLITAPTLLTPSPVCDTSLSPAEVTALGIREMEHLASQAAITLHKLIYEDYDGTISKRRTDEQRAEEERRAYERELLLTSALGNTDASNVCDGDDAESDEARAEAKHAHRTLEEEVRAVTEYKTVKERIERKINGSINAQMTIQQLRDRLKELEGQLGVTVNATREVNVRVHAGLREICEKYDTVMLPLEIDLELFTDRFIQIATQEASKSSH